MKPPAGRPRIHPTQSQARAVANARARESAKSRGLVQRSVWLSQESWAALRVLRSDEEQFYGETLSRLIAGAAASTAD